MEKIISEKLKKNILNFLQPGDCILTNRISNFRNIHYLVPGAVKHGCIYIGNLKKIIDNYGNLLNKEEIDFLKKHPMYGIDNLIIDVNNFKYNFLLVDEVLNNSGYIIIARHPNIIKTLMCIKKSIFYLMNGHYYSLFNNNKSYCFDFINKCYSGVLSPHYIFFYPFFLFPSFKRMNTYLFSDKITKQIFLT